MLKSCNNFLMLLFSKKYKCCCNCEMIDDDFIEFKKDLHDDSNLKMLDKKYNLNLYGSINNTF